MADSKYSEAGRRYIGRKIRHLVDMEGKTQNQAVGQAMGMARQKGLRVPEKPASRSRFGQRIQDRRHARK
jgi:hypothetical protein